MNAELISIPSLATLTTRRLACSNFEFLSLRKCQKGIANSDKGGAYWKTNWPFHRKILGSSPFRELATDFFERLNTTAGEGNSDAVNFLWQD